MQAAGVLRVKLFLDGAEASVIRAMSPDPTIKGFTTNPSLMRKAGIVDYAAFARKIAELVAPKPISFEVFSDDFATMEREARVIASFGANVYVKVPVTNTRAESSARLIHKLSNDGIALNVTAILTLAQVREVGEVLALDTPSIVSVFAGRIADTGIDPVPIMTEAVRILRDRPQAELLWASPRELLNLFQANECGCHIITATSDVLAKLRLIGKDLGEYSLETVQMFYNDAKAAGYKLVAVAGDGKK
jgi:transaldolase